ncbi:MAG TPA: methyltransferase domain-containing protein [Rhizomicrobium sp.]
MKEIARWKPSKAAFSSARWRASRDPAEISPGSRAIGDWLIGAYEAAIAAHAHGALVDIGCGKFPYYGIYRDRTSSVLGIDWPNSLHDNPHVDKFCDLNEGVDLPDACADTVLCTDVLEHIYRPARLWSEIARILKPGGRAIIGTPFYYWIHEAPHDYYRYTRFALERQARDAGFDVVSIEPVGGLPHVLTDILCKACQYWAITRPLTGPLQGLTRLTLKHGAARRFAQATARRFPLAYVTIAAKPAAGASPAGAREEIEIRP